MHYFLKFALIFWVCYVGLPNAYAQPVLDMAGFSWAENLIFDGQYVFDQVDTS